MRFFAYGSMMFPRVMWTVTGQSPVGQAAVLIGYNRQGVANATYPGIIKADSSSVAGKLYAGLDATTFLLLDRFEGEYYERKTVDVSGILAETYVIKPRFHRILNGRPWNPDTFRIYHLAGFLRHYRGFNAMHRGA